MPIKSLIFLADFSDRSTASLTSLLDAVGDFKSLKVNLAHVDDHIHVAHKSMPRTVAEYQRAVNDEFEAQSIALLESLEEDYKTVDFDYNILVGNPAHQVNMLAEKVDAELIVMCRRRTGQIGPLTSFSYKIARGVNAPILIIPDFARFRKTEALLFACELNEITESDIDKVSLVSEFLQRKASGLFVRDRAADSVQHLTVSSHKNNLTFKIFNSRARTYEIQSHLKDMNALLAIKKSKKSLMEMVVMGSVTKSVLLEEGIGTLII